MTSTSKTTRIAIHVTRALLGLGLIALLAAPEAATFADAARDRSRRLEASNVAARKIPFRVRGRVAKLYPGARKAMTVKIINRNRYPIAVKNLIVRVLNSNKPGCEAKWVRPRRKVRMSLRVPARARAFASVPVKLRRKAPNECQGARWRLKFRGRAVRWQ